MIFFVNTYFPKYTVRKVELNIINWIFVKRSIIYIFEMKNSHIKCVFSKDADVDSSLRMKNNKKIKSSRLLNVSEKIIAPIWLLITITDFQYVEILEKMIDCMILLKFSKPKYLYFFFLSFYHIGSKKFKIDWSKRFRRHLLKKSYRMFFALNLEHLLRHLCFIYRNFLNIVFSHETFSFALKIFISWRKR